MGRLIAVMGRLSSDEDTAAALQLITQVAMLGNPVFADERVWPDVRAQEICDGIAAGLVEEEHIFAFGDPLAGQLDSEPSAKGIIPAATWNISAVLYF